ncbi:MAG TPA: hypothetical protein PLV25_07415, partial [Opitutales bacterium]|nr:hypothetical protein [Opitutales bacterium]
DSLEVGNPAELTLFKALFKFASQEGFAVRAGWWAELPENQRTIAARLLQTPAASMDASLLVHTPTLYKGLTAWLSHHTAIRL